MELDRATPATSQERRPAQDDRPARGHRCDALHRDQLLPVADAAQGFSAGLNSSGLFLRLAQRWPVADDLASMMERENITNSLNDQA